MVPHASGRFAALVSLVLVSIFLIGCGSSSTPAGGSSGPGQSVPVTLLFSGTSNDFVAGMDTFLSDLTLTDASGNKVTVLSKQQMVEAIHAQASPTPVLTVNIPEDTYTSAQFDNNQVAFLLISYEGPQGGQPGILEDSVFQTDGDCCAAAPTITMPSPITISGPGTALLLNLNASGSLVPTGLSYAEAEKLTITAEPVPTKDANGHGGLNDIYGQVTSVSSTGFQMLTAEGATLAVTPASTVAYQGVSSLSTLQAGMFLVVDGSLQNDGSLQGTRIFVPDLTSPNMVVGLVDTSDVSATSTEFTPIMSLAMGSDPLIQGAQFQAIPYNENSSTSFQISTRLTNLSSLPFTPVFSSATFYPGQVIWTSVPAVTNSYPYEVATTLTLVPQTIDGTIEGISTSGSFTVYTLLLSTNDYMSAVVTDHTPSAPSTQQAVVYVYVDSNTQGISSSTLNTGTVARFNGLLFNDNGTLRMDAETFLSGVAE